MHLDLEILEEKGSNQKSYNKSNRYRTYPVSIPINKMRVSCYHNLTHKNYYCYRSFQQLSEEYSHKPSYIYTQHPDKAEFSRQVKHHHNF